MTRRDRLGYFIEVATRPRPRDVLAVRVAPHVTATGAGLTGAY